MNHFEGITPDQRWRNEMLNEQRETNSLLRQLLGHNAQVTENVEVKTQRRRGRKGAANQ